MKAFHSMTSKVANILSPLSGFVWALRPEARKKCCSITDIYVSVSMGHSWHARWVSKWSRHHLLEWVTLNEKPAWWGSLPKAQNLCLELSPKGLDLPEANSSPGSVSVTEKWLTINKVSSRKQRWDRYKAETWFSMGMLHF